MSERSLRALIDQTEVGILKEENGIWGFQYSNAWLNNPQAFALSPHLPLTSTRYQDSSSYRPVQWYFDNLLPEEGQRTLLAKDARIDTADAFALLGYYGSESAGSLTLLPEGAEQQLTTNLRPLPDHTLEERIKELPRVPLTHAAVKRMSLAGAQHKLAVVLMEDKLYEPAATTPSLHILKPDHPDPDYSNSAINEWFVMRLAKRVGLNVPNVHRRYVPSPVYLVDRFDRFQDKAGWHRRHVIDACQLLNLARDFKYAEGSIETLSTLALQCRNQAASRTRLFVWLVFNVLIGNSDAHLKNLSFMVSHEGIQVAPFYDLLSVAVYESPAFEKKNWPKQTQLAWPILNVQHFSAINHELLVEAGKALNLSQSTSERYLQSLLTRITKESETLYSEVERENSMLVQARPELAATFAGETRCLRAILHNVIKEMARQLNG